MIQRTRHGKKLLALLLGFGLLFLVGCGGQVTPSEFTSVPGAVQPGSPVEASGTPGSPGSSETPPARGAEDFGTPVTGVYPNFTAQGTLETGISVSGQGQASGTPDLAVLNLGVESFAGTVAEARSQAAGAMEDVLAILQANDIEDKDIQTRFFNISPRYTYREVTRCVEPAGPDSLPSPSKDCFPEREQVITGYQVSNQLTVKVRDLDAVGDIINQTVQAGGNFIRFQGINFTIENSKDLEEQARAAAVEDLMDKAGQLANLTGVQLGSLVSITETSGPLPLRVEFSESRVAGLGADVSTPIMPGEQSVTVTVQGVFAIQ